jgi:hypothetical protein
VETIFDPLAAVLERLTAVTISVYLARPHSNIHGAVHGATDKPRWTKAPAWWSLWGL